jgi:hypothetical protein
LPLSRLSRGSGKVSGFHPATPSRDDRRFVFSSADILSALAPAELAAEANRARACLAELCPREASALAFMKSPRSGTPVLLAVAGQEVLAPSQLVGLMRWSLRLLSLSAGLDPALRWSSAVWAGTNSVITWRGDVICYAAVCRSRPASAMLSSALGRRPSTGTSGTWPVAPVGSP